MPFDGSGNYSRVHDWTDDRDNDIKIRADRMDEEFDDIASAFNVVFFRNGLVPMSGDLDLGANDLKGIADGTNVAPSVQFETDPNTGLYLNGAGKLAVAANGVRRFEVDTAGAEVVGTFEVSGAATLSSTLAVTGTSAFTGVATFTAIPVFSAGLGALSVAGDIDLNNNNVIGIADGTALAPSIRFENDIDTGVYLVAAGNIGISVGGALRLSLSATAFQFNGSNVWTAGNDGSGSGLDADLLDGLQGSAYAQLSAGSNTFTGSVITNSKFLLGTNASFGTSPMANQAQLYYSTTNGLVIAAEGDTYDLVVTSKTGNPNFRIPTGSTATEFVGAVGIGMVPVASLSVSGAGAMARFRTGAATDGRIELAYNTTDIGYIGMNSLTELTLLARAGVDLSFGANGAEKMRLTSTGLGIGTTSPQRALHVEQNGATAWARISSGTSYSEIAHGVTAGNLLLSADAGNTAASSHIQLSVDGTERVRVNSSGYVGIGETNPQGPLHVTSAGQIVYFTRVAGDTGVSGAAQGIANTSTETRYYFSGTKWSIRGGAVGTALASQPEVFSISSAGVVSDNKGPLRSLIKSATTSGVLGSAIAGYLVRATAGVTIQDDVFAANDTLMIVNKSGGSITITQDTNLTLTDTNGNTGNRTLANHGIATVWFNSVNDAIIFGTGLS